MRARAPDVSSTLDMGRELLQDPDLAEEDRAAVQQERADLERKWRELQELISWKQDK